jgi:hypothetical protein
MGPESLEVLNMGEIGVGNGQQPKIVFENMPNLKQLQVEVESLDNIDLVSFKKLSSLEDLRLVVEQCSDERELIRILGNRGDLISFDCIVISDDKCALGVALWITPWYFSEKSLGILRLVSFSLLRTTLSRWTM